MARSDKIYLVSERGSVLAAFTVKHETQTWLDKNAALYDDTATVIDVFQDAGKFVRTVPLYDFLDE